MINKTARIKKLAAGVVAATLALSALPSVAAEMEEIVVKGDLGSLPGENVESVFGFGKSILETSRSVSTISAEQIERFSITDIDDLVTLAPGSFTQSFFGVAGSLDVRGTPGETYFRGVRRLDNPGNYPTPIGASDRIDIVRGPASPIYGPAKIGGYLNFNPKSARAEDGKFMADDEGKLTYTTGSWNKSVLSAEVGGPTEIGGQEYGYYMYGEVENSGSYYDNGGTDQTLIQVSFETDISDKLTLQFGGMYHEYEGNQNAGWNRLTQDLIDNGTYVTGSPAPLDTNGDGSISHQEYDVNGDGFYEGNPFLFLPAFGTPGSDGFIAAVEGNLSPQMSLLPGGGTVQLQGNQTLIAADDLLENEVTTLYFDIVYNGDDWTIKNQMFYESYENLNENAYGFSQFHDSYVFEDKLVFSRIFEGDNLTTSVQLSPSLRYTDFSHGDDYTNEYFDRRDLTGPSTALDRRLLATRIDDDYTEYYVGDYMNFGLAALVDFTFENGFSALFGVRWDTVDMESSQPLDKLLFSSSNNFCLDGSCANLNASDDQDGISWTASLSYNSEIGLVPYITVSEQTTVIAGQGAEIQTSNIASGGAFDGSELMEVGVKGSLIDNSLYFALSFYEQERTDFNAQAIVTNSTDRTEGVELELRWVVNENLLLTAGYSKIEVVNLNTLENGGRFSFLGAGDLLGVDPRLLYGGAPGGFVGAASEESSRKAGIPENIFSVTATYDFFNGVAVNASVVNVDSTSSGFSQSVTLPGYTLVNAGVIYETENWLFSLNGKNLTDERYFRANFPNLFGGTIVLPELPRHFQARAEYRF